MTFNCSSCFSVFDTPKLLQQHFRIHELQTSVEYSPLHREIILRTSNGYFCCKFCKFKTRDSINLRNHCTSCSGYIGFSIASTSNQNRVVVADATSTTASTTAVPTSDAALITDTFQTAAASTSSQAATSNDPVDITLNDPVNITSDDQSDFANDSSTELSMLSINAEVYNLTYQQIGVVIHIPSGAVICLLCKKAFPLSSVLGHFQRSHKLNSFIRQYNRDMQDDQMSLDSMQKILVELGAKTFEDQGLYVAPQRRPLPVIEVLPVEIGFACEYCPVGEVQTTAFFCSKRATMEKHMSTAHRGSDSKNYTQCHVQKLYNVQSNLVFFAVKDVYNGPTLPSTITEVGDVRFKRFLEENSSYNSALNPDTMINDNRLQSRFYTKVNWYGLVADIANEDTAENRILLHDWVNNLHRQPSDETLEFDTGLKKLVSSYFNYIQSILRDSSRVTYHQRACVMHDDHAKPFPTTGLDALNPASSYRYFNAWFKYLKMMILGSTRDAGSDLQGRFRRFGERLLTEENKTATLEFVASVKQLLQTFGDKAIPSSIGFPILHDYFMELVSEPVPRTKQMYKSSITVFIAFLQIDYLGKWKTVRHIKATPAMLKYCFRSIVFYDMLLESNELTFEDDIDNTDMSYDSDADTLDPELMEAHDIDSDCDFM